MNLTRMRRAVEFFKLLDTNSLTEGKEMPESFGRGVDLAEWNKEQYALWQDVREYLPTMSEVEELELFVDFAKFFYEYFTKTNPGHVPEVDDVLYMFEKRL